MLHAGIHFLPALLVDGGLGLLPDADEILNLADTALIVVLHLFIDSAAALHTVGPGYVVEPEQIAFRTAADIVVHRTIGLTVLGGGVGPHVGAAHVGAVEADAERVGLMVIDGAPLNGIGGNETVGLWTIVLVATPRRWPRW